MISVKFTTPLFLLDVLPKHEERIVIIILLSRIVEIDRLHTFVFAFVHTQASKKIYTSVGSQLAWRLFRVLITVSCCQLLSHQDEFGF